jgi:hypothetical protein
LFALSDAEASIIDPQQRVLTETVLEAVLSTFGAAVGISGAMQRYIVTVADTLQSFLISSFMGYIDRLF